jgi:flavin reductase (DIM6/NTAB) family NADH-FMN oxidoreductase RutF
MMDNVHRYFATTVGLITTKGSRRGPNVMAAEWTMHISYEPMLIAAFVHESPTYWNMQESRVFGVNIASEDQADLVNIAGGYSGSEIQKLGIPGTFRTYSAKHIDVPMIKGCVLSAECRVIMMRKIGDHIMVVGQAVTSKFDDKKLPLIYTRGNYRRLSRSIIPSGRKVVRLTPLQGEELRKMSKGKFVLKTSAAVIKQDGRILLENVSGRWWTLPVVAVDRGVDYKTALEKHLGSIGVSARVSAINGMKRVILKDGKAELRANFIKFDCMLKSVEPGPVAWFGKLPKNMLLRNLLEQP